MWQTQFILPESTEIGQGGLMEVALHPDYKNNGWIYLSVADPKNGDRRQAFTKYYRGKLKIDGNKYTWTDEQVIFKLPDENYNGSGITLVARSFSMARGTSSFPSVSEAMARLRRS